MLLSFIFDTHEGHAGISQTAERRPFDLLTLKFVKCHAIKVCTKFEGNQVIPSRVISNLTNLRAHVMSRCDLDF